VYEDVVYEQKVGADLKKNFFCEKRKVFDQRFHIKSPFMILNKKNISFIHNSPKYVNKRK